MVYKAAVINYQTALPMGSLFAPIIQIGPETTVQTSVATVHYELSVEDTANHEISNSVL